MISAEEFVRQWMNDRLIELDPDMAMWWGSYELVKYDAEAVSRLPIPEASKEFLLKAGLPTRAWMHFRFATPYPVFAPLTELESEWPEEYYRYHYLGVSGVSYQGKFSIRCYLCLDERANGRVVSVELEDQSVELMNSSVEQLAEYLLVLRQYMEWQTENKPYDEDSLDQILTKVREVGNRLRTLDPPAAANWKHWGRVIAEIEDLAI